MNNSDIIISVCLSDYESSETLSTIKQTFIEKYQTDNVVVIAGMGFNQIAITNPITNETTLLNPKHD
jgi:hypothetical protein